ncbi:MAG: 50S ribosomal protein L24 [Clostridiales bacterium]|nr:50S ribosomal protein L24 [Clostridiales bacterium]
MASMNVRSGDTVEIIVGDVDSRGKRGKVIVANPKTNRVVVEGLNLVTKHRKPRSAQEQGGKFEQPRPIDVSNVALVCPKCNETTRVGHVLGENGKYLRACKKCGAVIDAKAEKKQARTAKAKTAPKKSKKSQAEAE